MATPYRVCSLLDSCVAIAGSLCISLSLALTRIYSFSMSAMVSTSTHREGRREEGREGGREEEREEGTDKLRPVSYTGTLLGPSSTCRMRVAHFPVHMTSIL